MKLRARARRSSFCMGLSTQCCSPSRSAASSDGFQRRPPVGYETRGRLETRVRLVAAAVHAARRQLRRLRGYNRGGGPGRATIRKPTSVSRGAPALTRIDARAISRSSISRATTSSTIPWSTPSRCRAGPSPTQQAKRLRDYLLKGGFLMVDDFHGTDDWESFMRGMRMVLPADQSVADLDDNDEIFHVLYDIDERFQCPANSTSTPAAPTKRTATSRSGAPSATTRAASWSPSATTCTWATPGSGPTTRLSGEVRVHGVSRRHRLHHVRHDPLDGAERQLLEAVAACSSSSSSIRSRVFARATSSCSAPGRRGCCGC